VGQVGRVGRVGRTATPSRGVGQPIGLTDTDQITRCPTYLTYPAYLAHQA